jgi:hypothetical protein
MVGKLICGPGSVVAGAVVVTVTVAVEAVDPFSVTELGEMEQVAS